MRERLELYRESYVVTAGNTAKPSRSFQPPSSARTGTEPRTGRDLGNVSSLSASRPSTSQKSFGKGSMQ